MRLSNFLSEDDKITIRQRKRISKMIADIEERIKEIIIRQTKTDSDMKKVAELRKRKEELHKTLKRYNEFYKNTDR